MEIELVPASSLGGNFRYLDLEFIRLNREVFFQSFQVMERVVDPSAKPTHSAGQSSVSPNPTTMAPMGYNDGIPFKAIIGVAGELLEQNAQALNQISTNLASYQVLENIGLLSQTRDNLLQLLNVMNDNVPDIMKQMPQLPVKMNLNLANAILPPPPPPMP
ncbi:uncharacterized protein LOC120197576 [Hibiscus syriacus]|uniref:uncharacterized protein LOC120197576 n=1 Tax=Hibiscus syriacus TaxID=106335 RepID=UPI001924DF13|nr:uncharacterized protein LOC120197576 [Hibiscus syriacus]